MTRTVALLGATGYTGRLTAAELQRRGVVHRLGGRSAARLDAVPSTGVRHMVDLADPKSLDDFLDGVDAVISCAGPFAKVGLPVVEAAVRTGTPYVDSTGEPDFMRQVYEAHRTADSAVVPACGFDYIPGDLAAAIAAQELGERPEEVAVLYAITGGKVSRGTAQTAAGAFAAMTVRPRKLVLHGPDGPVTGVEVPWGEQVTVPLHLPGADVHTALGTPELMARLADLVGPAMPFTRPLSALAAPLLGALAARMPEGPSVEERGKARALVLATASAGGRSRTVAVRLRDVYGLTARFLVEAALTVEGTGAMAPAEALDPRTFLDAVARDDTDGDLSWQVV
jgi:Saccharopine dehydrogenase NADP binding domain